MNLSTTIEPKSTQLNADDLIAGPRTIKIVAVERNSAEQPVAIYFEGDNKRPYLPSKSMRRVLIVIWGADGADYIGRRLTLYRDPLVKFGGDPVGGIKISHASDIPEAVSISLTETRGKRKPHRVEPLPAEQTAESYPQGWDNWTLEQRAENRFHAGTAALQAWGKTLSKQERETVKPYVEKLKAGAAT